MIALIGRNEMFLLAFLITLLVVVRLLLMRNKNQSSPINLDYLIVDHRTNVISPILCAFVGWNIFIMGLMVFLTATNRLTEGYLALCILNCVAPVIVAVAKGGGLPTDEVLQQIADKVKELLK